MAILGREAAIAHRGLNVCHSAGASPNRTERKVPVLAEDQTRNAIQFLVKRHTDQKRQFRPFIVPGYCLIQLATDDIAVTTLITRIGHDDGLSVVFTCDRDRRLATLASCGHHAALA